MFREKVYIEKPAGKDAFATAATTCGQEPSEWSKEGPFFDFLVKRSFSLGYGNPPVFPGDTIKHAHVNFLVMAKNYGKVEVIGESKGLTDVVGSFAARDFTKAQIVQGDHPRTLPTDTNKARRFAARILRKSADELTESEIKKAFK